MNSESKNPHRGRVMANKLNHFLDSQESPEDAELVELKGLTSENFSNGKMKINLNWDKKLRSNSPPKEEAKCPVNEEKEQHEEQKEYLEKAPENIDIRCSNEVIDLDKLKISQKFLQQLPLEKQIDLNDHFKNFYQKRKDLFPPLNTDIQFVECIQSQVTQLPNESRSPLYKLRKTAKPPVKNLLPNEPYLKLTVIYFFVELFP